MLHRNFEADDAFQELGSYAPAPYRVASVPGVSGQRLLVNEIGEFHFLSHADLDRFVNGRLQPSDSVYKDLRSKHFIVDSFASSFRPFAAAQLRSRKSFLFEGPSLHIFVVTLRCDHSCGYCQVSRKSTDASAFDMSIETARSAVDRLFEASSNSLKVEFQGGESTLAFDRIRWIVEEVESRNLTAGKAIQFVIATTLANITADQLAFCHDHGIHLSTSLDGPAELHNRNRPRPGRDSFERTVEGIRAARDALGHDSVSALLTVTRQSLQHPEAIVDTYIALGFSSIFVRALSHHGFARKAAHRSGYSTAEFLEFYDRVLTHLVRANLAGHWMEESYITLLLRHMLTPFKTGYVDLRSPAGAGLGALVYNYDGFVYPSDEARMLVELGDTTFRLGRVTQPLEELLKSEPMTKLLEHGVAETLPVCSDCAFVPYCGADPINYWAHHGSLSGSAPEANFCGRQTHLFHYLFRKLNEGPTDVTRVLMSWLTRRPLSVAGAV